MKRMLSKKVLKEKERVLGFNGRSQTQNHDQRTKKEGAEQTSPGGANTKEQSS